LSDAQFETPSIETSEIVNKSKLAFKSNPAKTLAASTASAREGFTTKTAARFWLIIVVRSQ
jgi:hypothetical protein